MDYNINKEAFDFLQANFDVIKNLSNNFHANHVKNFSYIRIWKDGSYINLSDCDINLERNYFFRIKKLDNNSASHFKEMHFKTRKLMIWPSDKNLDPIYSLLHEYNHWNGVTILAKNKEYVELFSLGSVKSDLNQFLVNNVINNSDLYFKLADDFLYRASNLIKIWSSEKKAVFHDKATLDNIFETKDKFFYDLSDREQQCLFFLVKGYTSKMIAKDLNISYRTVEHYIASAKNKLCVKFKNELIKKISDCNFLNNLNYLNLTNKD